MVPYGDVCDVCNRSQKVPGSNPTRHSGRLIRTQPHHKVLGMTVEAQ